jgi:hypothetical protein
MLSLGVPLFKNKTKIFWQKKIENWQYIYINSPESKIYLFQEIIPAFP